MKRIKQYAIATMMQGKRKLACMPFIVFDLKMPEELLLILLIIAVVAFLTAAAWAVWVWFNDDLDKDLFYKKP